MFLLYPWSCRYQLLHSDLRSSVFVTEVPERVGMLLDYQCGRLAFYNAQSGQLLGSFSQDFREPCHPALALEMPGSLGVSMVPEVPEFTRDWERRCLCSSNTVYCKCGRRCEGSFDIYEFLDWFPKMKVYFCKKNGCWKILNVILQVKLTINI